MTIVIDAPRITPFANSDATDAIQAGLDAARGSGREVKLPPGRYRTTRPLRIVDDGQSPAMRGIHLMTENAEVSGDVGTTIEFDPPATAPDQPIIQLYSRDCILEGVALRVAQGKRALCGVDVDRSTSTGSSICTRNTFLRCQFIGANTLPGWGPMLSGVRIGATATSNCEFMRFDGCCFQWMGEPDRTCSDMWALIDGVPPFYPPHGAGILVASTTQQAKSVSVERCTFHYSPFGIYVRTGSLAVRAMGAASVGSLIHTGHLAEPLKADDINVEQCGILFRMGSGSANAPWQVVFENIRFACLTCTALPTETVRGALQTGKWPFSMRSVAGKSHVIYYGARGGLRLSDSIFSSGGGQSDIDFRVGVGGIDWPSFDAINCQFPNQTPFSTIFNGHERTVHACRGGPGLKLPEESSVRYP